MLDLRSYDATLWAWGKALDTHLERVLKEPNKYFYNADDKNTNILANQWDLPISQGLKGLLKEPLKSYFLEGTEYYLNKALSAVYGSAHISQWYEYGGEPYWFKVALDVKIGGGIDLGKLDELKATAYKFKNVRSVMEGIKINISTGSDERKPCAHIGAATVHGQSLSVYPTRVLDKKSYIGAVYIASQKLSVYPIRIIEKQTYIGAATHLIHKLNIKEQK